MTVNKKKFINYTLIGLNAISIIFILQIDFGIIPLIETHFAIERIERINNLSSNVSQGILISTFFYLLLVYFPEKRRASTIRKLIQPMLDTIIIEMQISIAYLNFKHNLNSKAKDFSDLAFNDFKTIERIDNTPMNFLYKIKFKQNDYWTPFGSGVATELGHFVHEREALKNKINEILSLPIISK